MLATGREKSIIVGIAYWRHAVVGVGVVVDCTGNCRYGTGGTVVMAAPTVTYGLSCGVDMRVGGGTDRLKKPSGGRKQLAYGEWREVELRARLADSFVF